MPTYTEEEPREIQFEELNLYLPEVLGLYLPEVLKLIFWKFGSGGRENQRETAGEV